MEDHIISGVYLFISFKIDIYVYCGKKEAYIGCFCSALYVVDLAKFRETAAGDQLRVVYETLSKDPNSLSNLDQVIERVSFGCFISVLLQTS